MESNGESENNEDLYQIALLVDQLKHEDSQLRVNATKNLIKIAKVLGPERTRSELIPFLTESSDDEEEILVIIAEKLGELIPYVGGKEYLHELLIPLEILSSCEETSVRDSAIASFELVLSQMSTENVTNYFFPILIRMANKDWFTARQSSASLFPIIYKRISEAKLPELRHNFYKLCSDEIANVRRSSAIKFGDLIKKMKVSEVINEVIPIFKALSSDDQDSVRIQVINICVSLSDVLPVDQKLQVVQPVTMSLLSDRSWRVRWSIANKIHSYFKSFGDDIVSANLCSMLENLLGDSEPEVRAAAALNLSTACESIRKDLIVSKILPFIHRLINDNSEHVRTSLSLSINNLALILGKSDTVEYLLPLLLLLLRDESSEVRLSIISNLEPINKTIGVELLSQSLLPSIVDLAEDSKWRVRLAILENIPILAKQLGSDFFNEKLNGIVMAWLGDHVYSVRRAAAENIRQLSLLFGEDWVKEHVIPRIERMLVHTSYLHRITALYCCQVILSSLPGKGLEDMLVPSIVSVSGDSVANVRFSVAKTLGCINSQCVSQDKQDVVKATLKRLSQESDFDVSSHARLALQNLEL